jgi:precorrin-6A/cobalt-precorrin-6A reductase
MASPLRTLILGGTTEAAALARLVAGDARLLPTLSLAGRTQAPVLPPIPYRIGGFGGIAGLVAYLRRERIAAMIDATHPFAAQMTRHAVAASAAAGVPLLRLDRPAWVAQPGDAWCEVGDMAGAARALGGVPRRVLLTIGQRDLAAFAACPWHAYLVRSVDPPAAASLPPGARCLALRGPFAEAEERALLARERIDVLVTKNSGGLATYPKLAAARALRIKVVMVARPPAPEAGPDSVSVGDAQAAHAWLLRGL